MKCFLVNLGINLVSLACIGIAGYMAVLGRDGWGWFLFVGLLCAASMTFKGRK